MTLEDGRKAEYFLYGSESTQAQTLVYFHGYTMSGSSAGSWDAVARERNVRVIGVSMAGWGASTPKFGLKYY